MQSGLLIDVTTQNMRAPIDTPVTAAYIDLRTSLKNFRGILRAKDQLNESGT
jgi:hypothetical protein